MINLEKFIVTYQHDALETKRIYKKLKNNTFLKKENSEYIDDMFDDSKIQEEQSLYKKPRIGPEYQVNFTKN